MKTTFGTHDQTYYILNRRRRQHSTNTLSPWEIVSEHFHGQLKDFHWSACFDVMLRPGSCQVLLYKGTETAEQLMCTAQLVQA